MADAQHLPQGRRQAGDRHLNFHESRDNLLALAGGLVALIVAARITRRRYPEMRLIGSPGTTTDGVGKTTP